MNWDDAGNLLVLQKCPSAGSDLERKSLRRPPAAHRPGAEHESLYHQQLYLPPGLKPLPSGLGAGRKDHLLCPFQIIGGGGV